MAWTKEQQASIDLEGNNIIVSAGAGSGKTAVLTERVLRKVKQGIHISDLLIMTFTNAAAKEMKDRIRKKLKEENYKEELDLIDSAYITTFDSFSLSIVKKYHYLLNLDKNISITDNSILNIEKQKLMDNLFDEYYLQEDEKFKKFIEDFCHKDDSDLKKLLIKLNDKLDTRIDKESYLNNYIENFFKEEKIESDINLYYLELKTRIDYIKDLINDLSIYVDGDFIEKFNNSISGLLNSKNYDEVVSSLEYKSINLPKNSEEDAKNIKQKIKSEIEDIKKLCIYKDSNSIKNEILNTKDNIEIIIGIIKEFDNRFTKLKFDNNMTSFNDISKMAIKIIEDNSDVRTELKEKFQEIMVDEYQDTNDIQEYFVSLISKNNVYMVGDIKQSIYRFRNANPYIFKNKYDLYSNSSDGIKIDLVKNFRSREEVLNNINLIFDKLMDDSLGGANYKESHQMVFGNNTYKEEGNTKQKYDIDILRYEEDKKNFSNSEKEIFIIGNDIKEKINNNYLVFDKDKKELRKAKYNDFVILIDRTTEFDLYKKIFDYLKIPITLYKDEEIKNDNDILIIRNILRIENAIDKEEYDSVFKYAFLSLGRSYLFNMSDKELFNIFTNNSFKESIIYKKCEELYNYYYEVSPKIFLLKLLEIFNYEEKLLTTNNIKIGRVRLEYFYNLLDSFSKEGKTIEEFITYLDLIFENDDKTTFSINQDNNDSVKIMTIHKSKGLEYPICYFANFSKKFNYREVNDNILYSDKYGIIIPYFNDYIKDTIYKNLYRIDTKNEEISEKIRLLYVALTRAKEKMIMVIPKIDEEKINSNPSIYEKRKITSFLDMINYIYSDIEDYIIDTDINCTRDYLIDNSNIDYHDLIVKDTLNIEELDFNKEEVDEQHFSKSSIKLISKEEKDKMEFGTMIHEKLELINFKNPNYDLLSDLEKEKIKAFLNSDLIKENIDSNFYKEYEFIYEEDNIIKHGIIDLMIENDNKIIIIDYKLKNIEDDAYRNQLLGYKEIIEKRSNKKIELYLYSILDETYKEIV